MKKTLALLLAAVMLFAFAACGGQKDLATDVLPVCLASEPNNIDPALNSSVDGATMVSHLFAGLAKWAKDETGKLVIVPECVEELTEGVLNDNGTITYTYTLKEGLKWSDGEPLTAGDFVFSWNRAASPALGADYANMYAVIDGFEKMNELKDSGEKNEEGEPIMVPVYPDAKLNIS